jgi:hypothetical protein
MTRLEQRRSMRKAAMPEVKKLVSRFSLGTVAGCLANLRERERTIKKIKQLRNQPAALARKV